MNKSRFYPLISLCLGIAMFVAACGGAPPTAQPATAVPAAQQPTQAISVPTTAPAPTAAPTPAPTTAPAASSTVDWSGPKANCDNLKIKSIGYSPLTMEFDYFQ